MYIRHLGSGCDLRKGKEHTEKWLELGNELVRTVLLYRFVYMYVDRTGLGLEE